MPARSKRVELIAAALLLAGGAAWLLAGPLNPPTGPVSSGGKTTQEIYDAVTGISSSMGAVGGRGPAVPGPSTTAGTIVVTGGQPFSSGIIGMRLSVATPTSGGLVSGQPALTGSVVTVVRAVGTGTVPAFRMEISNQAATSATITVPSSGGNTVYALSTPNFVGFRNYLVQRGDGTYGAIEELDILPQQIQVTDPSGATFAWTPFTQP